MNAILFALRNLFGRFLLLASFLIIPPLFSGFVHPQTIKVVTEILPPFQIENTDGSLGGYATEVIEELFSLTKDNAEISVLPWARAYKIAQNKPNVLIYSIARTPARENMFNWVGNLKFERFYFYGLKSTFENQQFESMTELKSYSVSSSQGYNSESFLIENGFEKLYQVTKDAQSIQMLYKNRIDIVLFNDLVFKTMADQLGLDTDKVRVLTEAKEMKTQLCIAFSKNTEQDIIERYKQAFQQLKLSGKLENIQKKWGVTDD